jgi:transglutaminase-like putative cysteine protease
MFWKTKKKQTDHKNIIGLSNTRELLFSSHADFLIPVSRGILCFLFVVGGLCGFVSCFTEEFNLAIILPVLFLASIIIAFVKNLARNSVKNWIYIIFLVLFIFFIVRFYVYVNSGYHAIVNLCYAAFENYLQVPALVHYDETIENPYVTITYFIIFCGILDLLLMHMWISERIRFWDILLISFAPFIVPLFVRLLPNATYIAILLTAYISLIILNSRPYVKKQFKSGYAAYNKHNPFSRTLAGFSYTVNGITCIYTIFVSFIISLVILLIVNIFMPSSVFEKNVSESALKSEVTDDVEYFVTFGLSGLFNRYSATGGLSNGKLGGIYSVRPDYETNLKVRYVPLSSSTVYLRGYVGIGYTDRQWYSALQLFSENIIDSDSYKLLSEDSTLIDEFSYLDEQTSYLKPYKMDITNVDADNTVTYAPYYSDPNGAYHMDASGAYTSLFPIDSQKTLSYYIPYDTSVKNSYLANDTLLETYLQVPENTRDEISLFLTDNELYYDDTLENVISKLSDILTDDFTYSLNPGITPSNQDFAGYFLNHTKKGYCAHFATAATLILRTLGIPARYVEGYVITSDELSKAIPATDANIEDYMDSSFITLGDLTQVVDVEIADDKAHAWVEYYDPDFGWRVFEATTAALQDSEYSADFWNSLYGIISRTSAADNDNTDNSGGGFSTAQFNKIISRILIGCAVILALGISGFYVYRYSKQYRSYHRNNRNINVRNYYKIVVGRIKRKYPEFDYIISINEQLDFIKKHYPISKRINASCISKLAVILEHSAFAREEITYSESKFALNSLKLIRRNILFSLERIN